MLRKGTCARRETFECKSTTVVYLPGSYLHQGGLIERSIISMRSAMEYLYSSCGGRCSYAKSHSVDALEICRTLSGVYRFSRLPVPREWVAQRIGYSLRIGNPCSFFGARWYTIRRGLSIGRHLSYTLDSEFATRLSSLTESLPNHVLGGCPLRHGAGL